MTFRTVESYSVERPLEIDEKSSSTVTYVRKNIREVANEDGEGTHWRMDETILTKDEYEWYKREIESPSLDAINQRLNDIEANQAMAEIQIDDNNTTTMQMLNDISADIALLGETEE